MNINPSVFKTLRLYHYTTFPIDKILSNARLKQGEAPITRSEIRIVK